MESVHCYANNLVRGDLSSIKWIEGPLTKTTQPPSDLVEVYFDSQRFSLNSLSQKQVYYSSLNFKDVMIASGRLNLDVLDKDRKELKSPLGIEFSGKTLKYYHICFLIVALY